MKKVKGDLLQLAVNGEFDVIIHGCNCFCTMGAGIAKTIKQKFPEAYDADAVAAPGDRNKLGTISIASIVRGKVTFDIVNAYTQFDWRGTVPRADYDAIKNAFAEVRRLYRGHRIGYPAIGAGLAGGDWKRIAEIIELELAGEDHTFVEWLK